MDTENHIYGSGVGSSFSSTLACLHADLACDECATEFHTSARKGDTAVYGAWHTGQTVFEQGRTASGPTSRGGPGSIQWYSIEYPLF